MNWFLMFFLETQNELAEGGREGYENINVMYNILTPNLQLLRDIESITPGDAEADCKYLRRFIFGTR